MYGSSKTVHLRAPVEFVANANTMHMHCTLYLVHKVSQQLLGID